MAENGKVVINLATGLEDPERVMISLLVGEAAVRAGKDVVMFLTKEAVRLAVEGVAVGTACDGCPSIERLLEQYAEGGGRIYACPICLTSRSLDGQTLVGNATIAGATPLWEFIGEGATVFDY